MKTENAGITQARLDGEPEILLIEFYFSQGTLYVTDAPFDFDYDGNTYLGNGSIMTVGKIKSTVKLSNQKKNYTFSGADQSMIATVMGASQINREVIERRAYLNHHPINGYVLVDVPVLEWQGIITRSTIKTHHERPLVTIETGTLLADFDRRVNRSTTVASQQRHFPNDTGMRYASETEKEVKWGRE